MRSVLWFAFGLPLIACGGGAARAPGADVAPVVNPGAQPRVVTGTPGCPELPTEPVIDQVMDSGTTIELLNDGEAPRQALRYHPDVGARVTAQLRMDMDMDSPVFQMQLPTIAMTTITDVTATDGDQFTTRMVFEEVHAEARPGIEAETVALMDESMAKMRCATFTVRSDARGTPIEGRVIGVSEELAPTFDQLQGTSFVLPHEPVGAGASWEIHTHRVSNGIEMEMTMIVDLVSVDGDAIELRGMLSGTAPPQTIRKETVSYELTSMNVLGELVMTYDLAEMTYDGWMKMDSTMEMAFSGTAMTATSRVAMKMSAE